MIHLLPLLIVPQLTLPAPASISAAAPPAVVVQPTDFQLVRQESGPVNYFSVMSEDGKPFLRARYLPPMKTVVVGWKAPESERQLIRKIRWTWRAQALPVGGDECTSGKEDSAAVVYLTWKGMIRYYTIKYVWSSVGARGRVCDTRRNPLYAQDTVLLESGGPLGRWKTEEMDLAAEYRNHFEGGDPNADVPDFVGIGLMSDGDQTQSASSADYGLFALSH